MKVYSGLKTVIGVGLVILLLPIGWVGVSTLIPDFPTIHDPEKLVIECRELVDRFNRSEDRFRHRHLAPEDRPEELARLNPRVVSVHSDRVILRLYRRAIPPNPRRSIVIYPEEGRILKLVHDGRGDVAGGIEHRIEPED